MTVTIEGDLILEGDYKINDDLIVKGNIYGKDGKRYDIDCYDIDSINIDCYNIYCFNIDGHNINYFAVCFAYYNIKCKSIKGKRENCKHFVLDGKITIKDEVKA